MIDHISLAVADIDRSRAFYDRALAPLGARRVMDVDAAPDFAGSAYGTAHPTFWISGARPPRPVTPPPHSHHTAFAAAGRAAVDAFYREALAAGGRDDGPPGLRPEYHPAYYAAFVIDPDGHRIEAVCHKPE